MSHQEQRIEHLRELIAATNAGKNPGGQRTLTPDLRVKGGLFFGGKTALTALPDHLTVIGDLLARGTGLTALPEYLKVTGTLNLVDTAISTLPASLKVCGDLDIRKTAIKDVPAGVCLGSVIRTAADAENAGNGLNAEAYRATTELPDLPHAMRALIDFQNGTGYESYCCGFGVDVRDGTVFQSWTENEAIVDQLFCIGQANRCGSMYAFWRADSARPMHLQPIVAFGDEGGAWVVASTLDEFLRVLSFDGEPEISDEGVRFARDDEASENQGRYAAFVEALGLNVITEADELERLVQKAQAAYQQQFVQALGD